MPTNFIKFLFLSLSFFFIFISPTSTQLLPSYTGRQGEWNLLHSSIGISAMHMQLLRDNTVIMFDRTDFGRSNLSLSGGRCRFDPYDTVLHTDCTAHSVLYDIATNAYRPLMVETDTWCSSGAVLPNGTLVQTGGFNDGDHVVRTFTPCNGDECDWVEFPQYLSERRWYATNQILPDGRIIIVGGRRQFNYEFYPRNVEDSSSSPRTFMLRFLTETTDYGENNLYPFIHLLPDGNLFIFANTRSILLDYNQNRVLKEFPEIPGGDPRNYPSSGSSVLLPLDENKGGGVEAEIIICGGAPRGSFAQARRGYFVRALSTCGRLMVSHANPSWMMEEMPLPRVMGDMIFLPTGDVIIIKRRRKGNGRMGIGPGPMTRPIIYVLSEKGIPQISSWRHQLGQECIIRRLFYLTDGRVLIGGINPHIIQLYRRSIPTDLSLEAYSPAVFIRRIRPIRQKILSLDETFRYVCRLD
ncbi:Glyoxal oxidase-related protein [Melia azedarach]|nr:Glyoxal oxidase-related protein [Melia azedarach]